MKSILCAVDFTPLSALALRHAASLAVCSQSRLAVVHATHFEAPPYFTGGQQEELRRLFVDASAQAREALRNFVTATVPEVAPMAELVVEEGVPADVIANASARLQPSLTVMGTHGEGGLTRVLMGSVAEQILRTATLPVLTISSRAAGSPFPPRKILVAVNQTPAARAAVAVAADLAHCLATELTLLQVEEHIPDTAAPDVCDWVPADVRRQCSVQALKAKGDAGHEILRLARDGGYGMVVIGARHRLFFDATVLGTTTVKVVRHAPVPVLTVFAPQGA